MTGKKESMEEAAAMQARSGPSPWAPLRQRDPSDAKDKGRLPDEQNRFKLSLNNQISNAAGGIGTSAFLRDSGINLPRTIELKIHEEFVSRGSYQMMIIIASIFGIGLGFFIYSLLPDSCNFSFLGPLPVERWAFFFVGATIGAFIGHSETAGRKRCNPKNERVLAEGKAYQPCLDDSDCTDSVDRGDIPSGMKMAPFCSKIGDVGKIGMARRIMLFLFPLLSIILFVTAHLADGLQLPGSERAISSMSGISLGIFAMVMFSPNPTVHTVDSIV